MYKPDFAPNFNFYVIIITLIVRNLLPDGVTNYGGDNSAGNFQKIVNLLKKINNDIKDLSIKDAETLLRQNKFMKSNIEDIPYFIEAKKISSTNINPPPELTLSEISGIIEAATAFTHQNPETIAETLHSRGVSENTITIFFAIKGLPDVYNIPEEVKHAKAVNKRIEELERMSLPKETIMDRLYESFNHEIVDEVYAARQTDIGTIPQKPKKQQPKPQPQPQPKPQPQQNREFTPEEEPTFRSKISIKSTNFVRSIFKNEQTIGDRGVQSQLTHKRTGFYTLVSNMYSNCEPENREVLRSVLNNTTTIDVEPGRDTKTLSQRGYYQSVDNLDVIQNTAGGDCLFLAVAQAINYHNFHNQQNRIIYQQLGIGNNEFTNQNIRELVAEFFQRWPQLNNRLQIASATTVQDLNGDFEKKINDQIEAIRLQREGGNNSVTGISPEVYREIVNDTYKTNPNFLAYSDYVFNPNSRVPDPSSPEYLTPFRVLTRGEELTRYILSPFYWGGSETIIAISNVLKLQIIPTGILVNNTGDRSNPNYKIASIQSGHTNFDLGDNEWTKYLFLYYNAGDVQQTHFELITFLNSNTGETTTIFDRSTSASLPPLYILFTIFGLFYTSLLPESRRNFPYRRDLMETMYRSIVNLKNTGPAQYGIFYSLFKKLFPNSQIEDPNSSSSGGSYQLGGYPPYGRPQYGRPQYGRPQYGRPQYVRNIIKNPEDTDNNHLSYYITIELQLYPGTSISPEQRKGLKCNHKWNMVRNSYAQLVGKPYNIKPDYSLLAPPKQNNYSRPIRRPINKYNTRAYRQNQYRRGGKTKKNKQKNKKHLKTRKM